MGTVIAIVPSDGVTNWGIGDGDKIFVALLIFTILLTAWAYWKD